MCKTIKKAYNWFKEKIESWMILRQIKRAITQNYFDFSDPTFLQAYSNRHAGSI